MRVVKQGKIDLYKGTCSNCSREYDQITIKDIGDILPYSIKGTCIEQSLYECPNCTDLNFKIKKYSDEDLSKDGESITVLVFRSLDGTLFSVTVSSGDYDDHTKEMDRIGCTFFGRAEVKG